MCVCACVFVCVFLSHRLSCESCEPTFRSCDLFGSTTHAPRVIRDKKAISDISFVTQFASVVRDVLGTSPPHHEVGVGHLGPRLVAAQHNEEHQGETDLFGAAQKCKRDE